MNENDKRDSGVYIPGECHYYCSNLEDENKRLKDELDKVRIERENICACGFGEALEYAKVCEELATAKGLEATLKQIIFDLLLSADSSWEERGEGHDWPEACQAARKILEESSNVWL